MMIIAVLR
jgi:hypothetical protein